jgi:hypothetical protein
MGIVFGSTGTKEPTFRLLSTIGSAEIRHYRPYVVAEVMNLQGESNNNNNFGVLARYIGVFGKPENQRVKPMAMTSPVISEGQKLAMTSPVVTDTSDESMAFVLPEEIQSIGQAPVPTDQRVVLREVPTRIIASFRYSGWYNKEVALRHANTLRRHLTELKLLSDGADATYEVAQYHPPFTLGPFRRNEIWIPLGENNPEVRALVQSSKGTSA